MFTKFYEKASEQNDAAASQSSSSTKAKKRRRRRNGNRDKPAEPSDTAAVETKRKSSSDPGAPPQTKRSRRQRPSEQALALSAKLKEYSSQKRLSEALELYWHESNDSIRDEHHACIVVDCSARCGCIAVSCRLVSCAITLLSHHEYLNTYCIILHRKEKRLWMK